MVPPLVFAIFLSLVGANFGPLYPRYQTTDETNTTPISDLSLTDLINEIFFLEPIKTKLEQLNGLNGFKLDVINAIGRIQDYKNLKFSREILKEISEVAKFIEEFKSKNHKSAESITEAPQKEIPEKYKLAASNFRFSTTISPFLFSKITQNVQETSYDNVAALFEKKIAKRETNEAYKDNSRVELQTLLNIIRQQNLGKKGAKIIEILNYLYRE